MFLRRSQGAQMQNMDIGESPVIAEERASELL